MNLFAAADHLSSLERSAPHLETQRCLHALDKYSDCEACLGLCPTNAIEPGKPPKLVAEQCIDCFACLAACPTGAYLGDDAVPALITAAGRSETQTVELICEHHPNAETGSPDAGIAYRVRGCLAGLGAGTYLALIALGKTKVILRTEACVQCRFASLQSHIKTQIEDAHNLLQAWGHKSVLVEANDEQPKVKRPVWDADTSQLSRRDLFRLTSRQGQTGLARTLAQNDEGSAGRVPPRQRQQLLKALAHLPAGNAPGDQTVTIHGFAKLTVTDQCTACGACVRACPTSALQMSESEMRVQLTVTPQACTGCEICAHVCLPNALTVNRSAQLTDVFGQTQPAILFAGELKQCPNCHAHFASQSGDTLCPICRVRQANPFGSHFVPNMKKVR